MSKRIPAVLMLAAVMAIMATAFAYAGTGDLKLTSSYPEDGQTNTAMENVGVKLHFSAAVDSADTIEANKAYIKIVDNKDKQIPVKTLAKGKEFLVLADMTKEGLKIKNNSEYTVIIDPAFTDNQGNTLGAETRITFKTFNQRVNNAINMGMMIIMMGAILVVTIRQTANKDGGREKAAQKEAGANAAFNPYREARRTGKSVEEVVAEEEARRARSAKKNTRKEKKASAIRAKLEEDSSLSTILPNVYSVRKPAPISAAGSKHVSGRGGNKTQPAARKQSKTRAGAKAGAKKSGGKKK